MGKRLSVKHQGILMSDITTEIPANGIITVGNDPSSTIELPDRSIAPEQFVIVCEPDQIILMCRVDGTKINGKSATQGTIHKLQNGDQIILKNYEFIFESDENNNIQELSENSLEESEEESDNKNEKTLTDVLQSLRTEEKFYLKIETKSGDAQKLFIEDEEVFLGLSENGKVVLDRDENEIQFISAQIRKDWSGVVIYPFQNEKIWLGNNILGEPYHLKNDDLIFLQDPNTLKPDFKNKIRFHEPTSLLALDSILPKELPPPISLEETEIQFGDAEEYIYPQNELPPPRIKKQIKKLYFGYFTITEIIIMIIGTLITSVLIFLILEFY